MDDAAHRRGHPIALLRARSLIRRGGAQGTLSTYGLQRRAPDHIRGRILAGDFGIVSLIITLWDLSAGALAGAIGVRPTIAAFALLGPASGAVHLIATRGLRARLGADTGAALASAAG